MLTKKMTRKWLILLVAVIVILTVVGELVARLVLGLGDPPLSITHPSIEYMCKPSTECFRFGNRYSVNEYSQRSDSYSKTRVGSEVRILVAGDSVPNGGGLTAQSELATDLLKSRLESELELPVVVGNVSAGSWGPPNLLAYFSEYGSFDVDVVVIILNKDDLFDRPTFQPLNQRTHPTESPVSALFELFDRYVYPRVLSVLGNQKNKGNEPDVAMTSTLPELTDLLHLLRANDCKVYVLYHTSRNELWDGLDSSFVQLEHWADKENVDFFNILEEYRKLQNQGDAPFRDEMHPNAVGQKAISDKLIKIFRDKGELDSWRQR